MTEESWKESVARRALAAMKAEAERNHRRRLAACLEEWRPYILRRPSEVREVIQDRAFHQIFLETVGAKEA